MLQSQSSQLHRSWTDGSPLSDFSGGQLLTVWNFVCHLLHVMTRVIHSPHTWFFAYAAENLQCRRNSVFGCFQPWVILWVCASWKPCEHHSSKTSKRNFSQFWSKDVIWFIDVPIRFWGQKIKSQRHSRQCPENFVNSISQQELIRRWDTRMWHDISSYMITYLPLNTRVLPEYFLCNAYLLHI